MNCPVCDEAMIVLEWDQVEADHCPLCKGVWLDRGELELLTEKNGDRPQILSSFTMCEQKNSNLRKCPICLEKMEPLACGPAAEVRIDRCPNRDGFWFDAGELSQILKTEFFSRSQKVSAWLKDIFLKTTHEPR